jgi:hypothetical protein
MYRTGLSTIVLFVGLVAVCGAQVRQEPQTVTGDLIDLACYWQDSKNIGNVHGTDRQDCARACSREGFQVGLLTKDGKVFRVVGDLTAHHNMKLTPLMGQTVSITGILQQKQGQAEISGSTVEVAKH